MACQLSGQSGDQSETPRKSICINKMHSQTLKMQGFGTRAVFRPSQAVRTVCSLPHLSFGGRLLQPSPGLTPVEKFQASVKQRKISQRPLAAASDPPAGPLSSDDEPPKPTVMGVKISLEDCVYYINIIYFGALVLSVITGNKQVTSLASFTNFVNAMFLASAAFTGWSLTRWLSDVRQHLEQVQRKRDFRALMRYAWSAVFWLGFVLWYAVPPLDYLTQWTGTAGVIACMYGVGLAASSALMVGSWSFLGEPSSPRKLVTGGPYALLRHPQGLGNFLALVGFSLSGGAVAAAVAFSLSFLLYSATVVDREEQMLQASFGVKYLNYAERVPRYSWALLLLLLIEAVLIWRYGISQAVPVVFSGSGVIA